MSLNDDNLVEHIKNILEGVLAGNSTTVRTLLDIMDRSLSTEQCVDLLSLGVRRGRVEMVDVLLARCKAALDAGGAAWSDARDQLFLAMCADPRFHRFLEAFCNASTATPCLTIIEKSTGRSALSLLVVQTYTPEDVRTIEELLDEKVDVDLTENGWTPLMIVLKRLEMHQALRNVLPTDVRQQTLIDLANLLLTKGARLDYDMSGQTVREVAEALGVVAPSLKTPTSTHDAPNRTVTIQDTWPTLGFPTSLPTFVSDRIAAVRSEYAASTWAFLSIGAVLTLVGVAILLVTAARRKMRVRTERIMMVFLLCIIGASVATLFLWLFLLFRGVVTSCIRLAATWTVGLATVAICGAWWLFATKHPPATHVAILGFVFVLLPSLALLLYVYIVDSGTIRTRLAPQDVFCFSGHLST